MLESTPAAELAGAARRLVRVPSWPQLVAMEREAFEDERLRPTRQPAGDGAILDGDGNLVLPVDGMEMRRIMIAIKHRDRDPEEREMTGIRSI